jgi:hypothetical protein
MASLAASYATSKVSTLTSDELARGKQMATADLEKVKGDTINALKQLQGSILNSLTETETYALGQCLNRCKTAAKAMIMAHDASMQTTGMGGRKTRRTKKHKRNRHNRKSYRKR